MDFELVVVLVNAFSILAASSHLYVPKYRQDGAERAGFSILNLRF
jgi:hypothetical protein